MDSYHGDGEGPANPAADRSAGFWRALRIFYRTMKYLILFLLLVDLIIIPALFYNCSALRRSVVFWNFDTETGPLSEFERPQMFGLPCAKNIRLQTDDNVTIGIWKIPAAGTCNLANGQIRNTRRTVVIFCHGNAGSRRSSIRVEKYIALTKLGVDVVAFDYRGYGDSTGEPTAEGVVNDTLSVYRHIMDQSANQSPDVVLWGHSLGTGVAANLITRLDGTNDSIKALVLETPFDQIGNVLKYHIAASPFRLLPCFDKVYVNTVNTDPTAQFDLLSAVSQIPESIFVTILAAKDDAVVPSILAENLHRQFLAARGQGRRLSFTLFDEDSGLGHMFIHKSPEFGNIVRKLLTDCCFSTNEQKPPIIGSPSLSSNY